MTSTATSESTCTTQLLDFSSELQGQYETTTTPEERKERGQVFTPSTVARFMARLTSTPPTNLKVLDAGAGNRLSSMDIDGDDAEARSTPLSPAGFGGMATVGRASARSNGAAQCGQKRLSTETSC